MTITWYIVIIYSILLIAGTALLMTWKSKANSTELEDIMSMAVDFSKVFTNKQIYFLNIKVKANNDLVYYIDTARIKDADSTNLEWVVIDYIKDGIHEDVKLPSSMIFLDPEDANDFLMGKFTITELDHILQHWK